MGRSKAKKPISCTTVTARTDINKDGLSIPKGTVGKVLDSHETPTGYQRVNVDFEGVGKVEVAGSKIKCAP